MFNSSALEVAIGLVFCYSAVSLIVSSLTEVLATASQKRGRDLLAGLQKLFNDPQFNGLARDLYNHALVHPTGSGDAKTPADVKNPPSYIAARNFSMALLDVLQAVDNGKLTTNVEACVSKIANPQIRQLLSGILKRANGDVEKAIGEIGAWFEAAMNHVSGFYKRWSQQVSFGLGLLVAVAFNIDSLHLFHSLWMQPTAVAALGAPAGASYSGWSMLLGNLNTLPIGWGAGWEAQLQADWATMLVGWLITAFSVLFGAPFWFDILQNLVNLRGTGNKPTTAPAPVPQQQVAAVAEPSSV